MRTDNGIPSPHKDRLMHALYGWHALTREQADPGPFATSQEASGALIAVLPTRCRLVLQDQLRAVPQGQDYSALAGSSNSLIGRRSLNTSYRESLFPPHRRARVTFALCFFLLSLAALGYVSTL